MSNVLDRARKFLAEKAPEGESIGKRINAKKLPLLPKEDTGGLTNETPILQANRDLLSLFPNLIFEDHQISRVIGWLRTTWDVGLDIETYGEGARKEERSKKALSFVRGQIRLVQLSDEDGQSFILDVATLSEDAVASVLSELRGAGKALYLHNAIF